MKPVPVKTKRTYEAIYAAEIVRAFNESEKFTSFDRAIENLPGFHERAETLAEAWLAMVTNMETEGEDANG